MKARRGTFITLEGGEGSGKTTQVALLAEALKKQGHHVHTTREPGGTESAEAIRELVLHTEGLDAYTALLLHLAARREHVCHSIMPLLEEGVVVICDRFTDSTLAYQAYGNGLGCEYVSMLSRLVVGTLQPDITFFLDIPPEKGMERAKARSADTHNNYEAQPMTFHQAVYDGFHARMRQKPGRIKQVDATQSVDEVHQRMMGLLDGLV